MTDDSTAHRKRRTRSVLYFALVVEPDHARAWLKYGCTQSSVSERLDCHARYSAPRGMSKASLVAAIRCPGADDARDLERAIGRAVSQGWSYRRDPYGRGRREWLPVNPFITAEDVQALVRDLLDAGVAQLQRVADDAARELSRAKRLTKRLEVVQ